MHFKEDSLLGLIQKYYGPSSIQFKQFDVRGLLGSLLVKSSSMVTGIC